RNSVFTDTYPAGVQPTDNRSEHIWGRDILAGGQFVIENNTFGRTPGHNDAIDFDGDARPNPIPQILGNTFLGGGDDALDLETAAHVEGNVFQGYHKDVYNTDPGESNVLSAGGPFEYVVARNTFYDCDHVSLVKEDAFLTFVNNTVADVDLAAIYFDLAGQTSGPGDGAYVDGAVFHDTPVPFDEVTAETDLTIHRSIVPAAWHAYGTGNLDEDPRLVDPAAGDVRLGAGSPALGTGPLGLDMGAHVPAGAAIRPDVPTTTWRTDAAIEVGGPGISHYKYRLDGGAWSAETPVDTPITLAGLADAQDHTVEAVGRSTAGTWQDDADAVATTWHVDSTYTALLLSEVLADNETAVDVGGGLYPDLVELYYDAPPGAPALDLEGYGLTDDADEPGTFTFAAGAAIAPGEHLVLYAADDPGGAPGTWLGFGLRASGDDLFLFDAAQTLLDSVDFAEQAENFSIGRVGLDRAWALTQPTFGSPNVAQRTGDPAALVLNEWFSNGTVLFEDDFIELYNADALPVPLAGLYLTDNAVSQKGKDAFAPLAFIEGGGYLAVRADDRSDAGHVEFRLTADRGMVGLYGADLAPIDTVAYNPQTTDVSQGRQPDGAAEWAFYTLPTPGVTNPELVQGETTVETVAEETAEKWALVPTEDIGTEWRSQGTGFDTTGWEHFAGGSPGGVGYDNNNDYDPYISVDVDAEMDGGNTSCYIRIPFTFTGDPGDIVDITLYVRYDDGFVAYLNGQPVASDNAGTDYPAWNATSDGQHSDGDAVHLLPFPVDPADYGALVQGENLLAIHGLNVSLTSSDFLISAELEVTVETSSATDPLQPLYDLLDGLRVS
ncbi:MAG: lamin tail domain-containing protein, partial [Planctomycetota bacterium]|nr:lamin tail domain-containing protein [Planctomycetota bacterium]